MLPLYGIAAAVSWVLTGDSGARNVFEQRAGLADGGYTEKDLRPFLRFIVISRALALADAVYLLNKGGVVFNGKPRDIADDLFGHYLGAAASAH